MIKQQLIREMIKQIDWLDRQEALLFSLGIDRKYLKAVYMSGLEILSELNDGKLTILKEFKAKQWKMRCSELIDSMILDLKLYELHSNIKNLLNRL